jgi:hypothetical protein
MAATSVPSPIGYTAAELATLPTAALITEGSPVAPKPTDQSLLLMVFALNPTLFFTLDSLQGIPLFSHITRVNLRGKLRLLTEQGLIRRVRPGIFQLDPRNLEYHRVLS